MRRATIKAMLSATSRLGCRPPCDSRRVAQIGALLAIAEHPKVRKSRQFSSCSEAASVVPASFGRQHTRIDLGGVE